MTIQYAREILVKASSGAPEKIRGGRRGQVRRAIRFVRHSHDRTLNDLELVTLIEGMLDRKVKRWPQPHEMSGAVLFIDANEEMKRFVADLIENGRKFEVTNETSGYKVRLPKRRK